jgi:hypothetical protein
VLKGHLIIIFKSPKYPVLNINKGLNLIVKYILKKNSKPFNYLIVY